MDMSTRSHPVILHTLQSIGTRTLPLFISLELGTDCAWSMITPLRESLRIKGEYLECEHLFVIRREEGCSVHRMDRFLSLKKQP